MGVSVGDLKDKVVLVTGGSVGIGLAYAAALADAGARVAVTDIDAGKAEAAAAALRATGAQAIGIGADLAAPGDVDRLVGEAGGAFGRLDGLVNNAALMSALPRRPWTEIPVEEWDRVMTVNLRGLFLLCRAAYPLMREQGGSIVNIASTRAFDGTPGRLHYTTSKAGVVGFTRALAREVGPDGIRVNAVAPGLTMSDTQITASDPAYLAKLAEGRALARQQTPQDLVGAVLFLLSDASRFMTGQTLVVDGGRVMH